MFKHKIRFVIFAILMCAGTTFMFYSPYQPAVYAQQPTGSVPTVTGTPSGVIVAVYLDRAQEKVYSGPSSYNYPAIGIMLAGQEAPAYGISEDGNWIKVYYPGVPDSSAWIYAPYVKVVKTGTLQKLPAPPTPTPATTPFVNIDPTLMAAFSAPITATHLPTFTAPAPLAMATFTDKEASANRMPMGLLIFGFGFVGALGTLISFLRGR